MPAIAVRQQSPEWRAARVKGIGSSDAPILTGDAPWGDVLTLYAIKAGFIEEPVQDAPRLRWGLKLENTIAEAFTEATGLRVRRVNQLLSHPDHPWMLASLDRAVVGARALLEIKTARYANDEWGPDGSAEIPAHYMVQVQHQLAVAGYQTAYVCALFAGSDLRTYTIPRDDELIAALIDLGAEFMECVRSGAPPAAIIEKRRPIVSLREGEITADEPLAAGIEGVYHLRTEIKERKADLGKAEEAVKTLMGEHTAARAGEYRATYKQQADRTIVRHDLIAAAYRKALEKADPSLDVDAIESLFTLTEPGLRPLRISVKQEARDAA